MDPDYQINELAKKAGVSVRTIRFYIEEGLLPAPQVRGRYSSYTDEYLDRLELIRLLKDRFLPLKEIRRQVGGLDWEEVKTALESEQSERQAEEYPASPPSEKRIGEGSSALEYIERLMQTPPPARRQAEPKPAPQQQAAPPAPSVQSLPAPPAPSVPPPAAPESWVRITLAPGVELHVLAQVEAAQGGRIRQLVALARHLFTNPVVAKKREE